MVPIPEGHTIVRCPFCDLRSFVQGERGIRRYHAPCGINRSAAEQSLRTFLSSSMAIARDAGSKAALSEVFLAYLPFWSVWARVMAWAFGQKRVGSRDRKRYEPREVRIVEEIIWNEAACDVGEFGVREVPLNMRGLQLFQPELLHSEGMVFEPVTSHTETQQTASQSIESTIRRKTRLDRLSQLFVRSFKQRFSMVYYPLWGLRYLYRGRVFQVVVDGRSGHVLYGKAPGNTLYRAAVLVAGMAVGAFLALDVSTLILFTADDESALFGLVVGLVGLGVMALAYRKFRFGEQYEFKSKIEPLFEQLTGQVEMLGEFKDLGQWIDRLT
jgi:hypothetical protein